MYAVAERLFFFVLIFVVQFVRFSEFKIKTFYALTFTAQYRLSSGRLHVLSKSAKPAAAGTGGFNWQGNQRALLFASKFMLRLRPQVSVPRSSAPAAINHGLAARSSRIPDKHSVLFRSSAPLLPLFRRITIPHIPSFLASSARMLLTSPVIARERPVEEIYQKKTQQEHILLRPDSYIGPIEANTQTAWVLDEATGRMKQSEITYVPGRIRITFLLFNGAFSSSLISSLGLFKIYDEILVNAADNRQRDASCDVIKVDIDAAANRISVQILLSGFACRLIPATLKFFFSSPLVRAFQHLCFQIYNNGKGIPVEMHKGEKVYIPELIFGHLLTGSNFDDKIAKVTGGRNGNCS